MPLEVRERNLGDDEAEAFYTEHPEPALLVVQPHLTPATRRAREYEGHGYYRRPPKGGRRVCYALASLDSIDGQAIRAVGRVVDMVPESDVQEIKSAYLASENGDAYWIAFYAEIHLHVVIAVLNHLRSIGEI